MRLETHIAFGLLIGSIMYSFFGFGFEYVLLIGFAAFIPDIDWSMQFKWEMGNRHRTFGHNIWFMLIVSFVGLLLTLNLFVFLSLILGMLTHFIADSMTVTGVRWLYPYEKKLYFKGPLSMSKPSERKIEKYFMITLLTLAGCIFLIRGMTLNFTSTGTYITLALLAFVGYALFKNFDKMIKKIIRNIGI